MRVHYRRQIGHRHAGTEGDARFRDKLAGPNAGHADAQDALRLRVDDELRDAIRPVGRQRPTRGAPHELCRRHLNAVGLRFQLRESDPRHLWVREDHCGDHRRLTRRLLATDHRDRARGIGRGLVGKQRPASAVTDGQNGGVRGPLLHVHADESRVVQPNACVLEAKIVRVGSAADGHENTVDFLDYL